MLAHVLYPSISHAIFCSTVRKFGMLYNTPYLEAFSTLSSPHNHRPNLCWKNGRVRAGKRVYLAGMGVGKRARVPGSRYKYFIWN
jgi:hypothetical protein